MLVTMTKTPPPDEKLDRSQTSEQSYTPEQLEKGRRIMDRIRQAAALAAVRQRLEATPPATKFIN
jgi:hypothetical protein